MIEDLPEGEEEQIIIRCSKLDEDLMQLIYSLKADKVQLIGYQNDEIRRVNPQEVFYFEAVDNKVYLYCEEMVMETKYRLYEVEELLENSDFLRISKSVILNITRVGHIKPAFNGRLEARLENGEKVIVSRQYVAMLKQKFGL